MLSLQQHKGEPSIDGPWLWRGSEGRGYSRGTDNGKCFPYGFDEPDGKKIGVEVLCLVYVAVRCARKED